MYKMNYFKETKHKKGLFYSIGTNRALI